MKRPPLCDVPGCANPRRRWQRLCECCWRALPGDIRSAILDAHHQRRRADHRRACRRAADHLAARPASPAPIAIFPPPRLSSEQAYDLTQRQLGER
jgi:hypothetical protein